MREMAMIKSTCLKISTLLAAICLTGAVSAQEDGKKTERGPDKGPHRPGSDHDPMRNLDSDERAKLREAMRNVWGDPSVVQSREDVDQSVKAFKAAIQRALLKKDPSLQPILSKMEKEDKGGMKSMMEGKGGSRRYGGSSGSGSEMRGFERMTESPSFLEKLSKEEKDQYFKVREKARQSPEIQAIMKRFVGFREQDDTIRRERTKVFGELRKTFHAKMIEIDPAMEAVLKNAGPPPSRPEGEKRGPKKEGAKKDGSKPANS